MKWRFGVEVGAVDGTTPADRRKAIQDADVILAAVPAGIPISRRTIWPTRRLARSSPRT